MIDWGLVGSISFIPLSFLALGLWVLYINRHDLKPQDPKHH